MSLVTVNYDEGNNPRLDLPYVFLGEILQVPGHGVFLSRDVTYMGLHMEDFRELTEDEV
jgi:hypothetical protein